MAVMVLMAGTDIETPTYYAVWWCLRPAFCLLRIGSVISTVEIAHSEGGKSRCGKYLSVPEGVQLKTGTSVNIETTSIRL